MKRIAFHTLGCKVNYYDECWIRENLPEDFEEVKFNEEADFYIINSCAVTKKAEQESRRYSHQAKKRNPQAIVIYTGCGAEIGGDDLIEKGWADFVVGNSRKEQIVEILQGNTHEKILRSNSRKLDTLKCVGTTSFTTTRAFLKIQEGCDLMCTYCVVPYTRGRSRSATIERVIEEMKRITDHGYREIVIVGIHLALFGKERGENLEKLLLEISRHPEFKRVRLTSLDPHEVTEELLRIIADSPNILPHFHLSFQSGHDELLKKMGRRYRVEDLVNVVERIKKLFDNPSIGVDVIVGFPGETDKMFERTRDLLLDLGINYIHPFTYSDRPGAPSGRFANKIPSEIKHKRMREMKRIDKILREEWARANIGRRTRVLVEEKKGELWFGYAENYLPVLVNGDLISNEIYTVEITTSEGRFGIGRTERT